MENRGVVPLGFHGTHIRHHQERTPNRSKRKAVNSGGTNNRNRIRRYSRATEMGATVSLELRAACVALGTARTDNMVVRTVVCVYTSAGVYFLQRGLSLPCGQLGEHNNPLSWSQRPPSQRINPPQCLTQTCSVARACCPRPTQALAPSTGCQTSPQENSSTLIGLAEPPPPQTKTRVQKTTSSQLREIMA